MSDVMFGAVVPGGPRGVHVIDPEKVDWLPPHPRAGRDPEVTRKSGVLEKWFVQPARDDDRFPVSMVRFRPHYEFPRHWHTDGEFILVVRGTATVGDQAVERGGMAYNDARTIYGAEAAGADGCDFLMIRRAWARNNLVAGDDAVTAAQEAGVTNSQDTVAETLDDRGLHVLDPSRVVSEVDPATGLSVRWLLPPDARRDRPPVAVVDLRAGDLVTWPPPAHGLFLLVLQGGLTVAGHHVPEGGMVYADAGSALTLGVGEEGAEVLTVQPITTPMHQAAG